MKAVTPVLLADPLGVERELRFTPGARKRIFERFNTENILSVIHERGEWAIFEIAYFMLFDAKGQPPDGWTLDQWMESAASDDSKEVAAAVLSAITQGRTPKNELMEMLDKISKPIGSENGPSAASVSASPTSSSGGDTPSVNLQPSWKSTGTPNAIAHDSPPAPSMRPRRSGKRTLSP